MIPVYVEKFLSEAEFEEARRNKLLSHQEVEREREEEEKRKKAEGEAAKAAEGRDISTPKVRPCHGFSHIGPCDEHKSLLLYRNCKIRTYSTALLAAVRLCE